MFDLEELLTLCRDNMKELTTRLYHKVLNLRETVEGQDRDILKFKAEIESLKREVDRYRGDSIDSTNIQSVGEEIFRIMQRRESNTVKRTKELRDQLLRVFPRVPLQIVYAICKGVSATVADTERTIEAQRQEVNRLDSMIKDIEQRASLQVDEIHDLRAKLREMGVEA